MKTKKNQTVTICKPKRDVDAEWCVAVFVDGDRCEARCYYTDDRGDAWGTYAAMVEEQKRAEHSAEVRS